MIELKKHSDYLEKMIYEIYPPNDDYELWGVEIKPGAILSPFRCVGFVL
jgi:hypothetical protein